VPNQCAAEGGKRRAVKSMALGSCVASHGEKIIINSINTMMTALVTVSGLPFSIHTSFAPLNRVRFCGRTADVSSLSIIHHLHVRYADQSTNRANPPPG